MCVAFLVLGGIVALANTLLSEGDAAPGVGSSAGSGTASDTADGQAEGAGGTLSPSDSSSSETQVTAAPIQLPAELLILGDSDVGTYAPPLQRLLDPTGVVRTRFEYRTSSGLARPDYFDWPTHMRTLVDLIEPQIVMVTFGGNDGQALRSVDGGTVVGTNPGQGLDDSAWKAEYGRRVGEVMDYLTADGRLLVWVGIPNDDEPVNTARMAVQDAVVREQAALRDRVTYVDVWTLFSAPGGGWTERIVDPRDGVSKDVRRDDGFHLNDTGAEILADVLDDVVMEQLRLLGAQV